ncbi:MAG: 4Fe-4S dicluster domain-containing protein [Marinilabiliales bacterium]|nr:MAG: 4Fe-4S dicluster domain-containing protein [Marinilabiliales bacterium]
MKKPDFHHALKIDRDVCIGCTHCMNICPTEAIRVRNGKAVLIDNRCVDCGFCYRVCPVNAIIVEQDDFNRIFEYKVRVALMPAVLTGQFPENVSLRQIHSELLALGFTHICEVEHGVGLLYGVMMEYMEKHKGTRPLISAFCPAIVRLIQVRFPALVENLIHLKPPLDISALGFREQLIEEGYDGNDIGIFYITPCAAKIAAVKSPVGQEDSPITGVINMNFLFNKAYTRVRQEKGDSCIVPEIRQLTPRSLLWSLTGGESDHAPGRSLAIDEIHNVINFLEQLENEEMMDIDFLELRACDESCAGGVLTTANRFFTVERLRKLAEQLVDDVTHGETGDFLKKQMTISPIEPRSMLKLDEDMSEAMKKLKRVEEITKCLPDVDCAACGSPNCQAFAEDIVQGYAKINQCVFVQRIFENRGILSCEESLRIMKEVWGGDKLDKNC